MVNNEYINKLGLKSKEKYLWVRSGKCNPVKCGSACCRFNVLGHVKNNSHAKNYHQMSDYLQHNNIQIRVLNRSTIYMTPRLCPNIAIDGKCELHNKRTQPKVCKYFPMTPKDGVYVAVKHVCGFKFEKINNPNYKKQTTEKT